MSSQSLSSQTQSGTGSTNLGNTTGVNEPTGLGDSTGVGGASSGSISGASSGMSSDAGSGMSGRMGSQQDRSSYGDQYSGMRRKSGTDLRQDLESLKQELDGLVSRAASLSESELQEAYTRMMAKFSSLRYAAKGVAAEATRQLNRSVDMTSDYVKDKPMQSVAMAAGMGLLMGMLFGRR